ncbi:MAG: heparinase II/III family protein [Phycisphaerae bacterium]|nr:heparinase II/III family protein [Phycisphaerae bacterium]
MKRSHARFALVALILLALAGTATVIIVRSTERRSSVAGMTPRVDTPPPKELEANPLHVTASWISERVTMADGSPIADGDAAALERALATTLAAGKALRGLPEGFLTNRADSAKLLRNGQFRIADFDAQPFRLPLDWTSKERGLTYLGELHSWRYVHDLLTASLADDDAMALEAMESIAQDWVVSNPFSHPASDMAWHEGAVSKRILVLLKLLNECRTGTGFARLPRSAIVALLLQHAEYLAWGAYYMPLGNHGIRQDIGLMAAAIGFPEAKRSAEWWRIANERIEREQIAPGFSAEGVWREHSPGYHYYVLRLWDDLLSILRANGVEAPRLETETRRFQNYLAHVLTPAGLYPPVGDTEERAPRMMGAIDGPEVRYALSAGREGTAPSELDGLFPDAGEMVFRETWGNDRVACAAAAYVHFRAGFHRGFGHRHQDDLSVLLYGGGRWWITEAGKYGYDDERARDFVTSAAAHNGYEFNGRALGALDEGTAGTFVRMEPQAVSTPTLAAARAATNRFPDGKAEARRTVIFLREQRTLLLIDELSSSGTGEWTQYIQFPPDLDVRPLESDSKGGHLIAQAAESTAESRGVLEVLVSDQTLGTVALLRGQESPMVGWHSPDRRELVPTTTAAIRRRGRSMTAVTLMLLHLSAVNDSVAVLEDLDVDSTEEFISVSWKEAGVARGIRVARSEPLAVEATGW